MHVPTCKLQCCQALSRVTLLAMETFKIEYSTKNIPQPSKHEFKIELIFKVESVIKGMRWKTLEFLGKLDSTEKETYSFNSCQCPPIVDELSDFEN